MDIMDWVLVIGTIGGVAFFFGGLDQWLLSPEKRAERRAKKLFRKFVENIADYQVHATWHVLKDGARETDDEPWMLHTQDVFVYKGKSFPKLYFEVEEGGVARQFQIFFEQDKLAPTHVTAYFDWKVLGGECLALADTKSYVDFMRYLKLTAGTITIKFTKKTN